MTPESPWESSGVQSPEALETHDDGSGGAFQRATEIVGDIARDTRLLADDYLDLIRHDIRVEMKGVRNSMALLVLAATFAAVALTLLAVAGSLALAHYLALSVWSGFALGGAAVLVLTGIIAALGAARMRKVSPPPAAKEAKEDAKWIADNT